MPDLTLADGGRLHYETRGSGAPLLLVTGLSGLASFWDPHVEALAAARRVVTHDHRGTGRSSLERIEFSVEQMAGDVLALMDALDMDRADLVGHSTGGAIGQVLAIEHPGRIRSLVLSSSWSAADDYFRYLFDLRKEALRQGGPRAYQRLASLLMTPPWWIRDRGAPVTDDAEALVPDPELVLRRIDAIVAFDRREELSQIRTPTLIICARDDIVTPAYYSEELAACIPGARLELALDGGHFYPVVHAERFREQVVDFLDT